MGVNRLYIGEGVTMKGEISVPDTLVACGSLEGDVTVGNLIVGETGVIKGRITVAENAEISGKVSLEAIRMKRALNTSRSDCDDRVQTLYGIRRSDKRSGRSLYG